MSIVSNPDITPLSLQIATNTIVILAASRISLVPAVSDPGCARSSLTRMTKINIKWGNVRIKSDFRW